MTLSLIEIGLIIFASVMAGHALGKFRMAEQVRQRLQRLDEIQDRAIEQQNKALRLIDEYNEKLSEMHRANQAKVQR